jgi:hypothetical protein
VYCGKLFRLTPPTTGYFWNYSVAFSPCQPTVSSSVFLPQIDSSGAIYVLQSTGGDFVNHRNTPEIYSLLRLTPPLSGTGTWSGTTIHTFTAAEGFPFTFALGPQGTIDVGTDTQTGLTPFLIDQLKPPTAGGSSWTLTTLSSSRAPANVLLPDPSGTIFAAEQGDFGAVSRLDPPGQGQSQWMKTTIHTFSGTDGEDPVGLTRFDPSGPIFGMTAGRTTTTAAPGDGPVVFRLDPVSGGSGWVETTVALTPSEPAEAAPLIRSPAGSVYMVNSYGESPFNGRQTTGTILQIGP